jgi:hypothetical protein
MLEKATLEGQLAPLANTGLRQRTSIYADDVVAFLRPRVDDLRTFTAIVGDFGVASGLRTNLCSVDVAAQVDQELGCPVLPFPLHSGTMICRLASGSQRRLCSSTWWMRLRTVCQVGGPPCLTAMGGLS